MVSAINPTTLTVTGEGLKNLKVEDVTLVGNEVASINPSTDGKTATITFKHNFKFNQEETVTIKATEGSKEFKFTYEVKEVSSVELEAKTYDDDTVGQTLSFKVNGTITTPDADFLRQAGFSVKFVAVNVNTNAAAPIFKNSPATESNTGLLADEIPVGQYAVEIQIIKNGTIVVSDKKTITVTDLESTTTAIKSVELTNAGATAAATDDFVQNSSTLVIGETATITDIVGNAAGKTDVSIPVGAAKVTSSNPAVLSVATAAGVHTLTANSVGTTTLTVEIGGVKHNVTLTVSNKARAITKITPAEPTVKLVQGVTRTIEVTAADQYGDPIAVATADVVEDLPKDLAGVALLTGTHDLTIDADGETTAGYAITASSTTTGNGSILFKDATTGAVLGSVAVQVTDTNNVTSDKVEYTYDSRKSNSFRVGQTAEYNVAKYNSTGFFNDYVTLLSATDTAPADGVVDSGFFPTAATGTYYVHSTNPAVATATVASGELVVTGVSAGTADIVVYDHLGVVKHTFKVTINAATAAITKVDFKALGTVDYAGKKVNISDVLDVRADTSVASADMIVYGVEHNVPTIEKVRVSFTASAVTNNGATYTAGDNEGILYIDNGATAGQFDSTDTVLGAVKAEILSGSTDASGVALTAITDIKVGGANYTTASKDKGQILYRVLVDANGDGNFNNIETVASTVLNIDVK